MFSNVVSYDYMINILGSFNTVNHHKEVDERKLRDTEC